jgi:TIR domain
MPRVFICYRRDDSLYAALAIYNGLKAKLGEKNVFLDMKGVDAGDDWMDVLSEKVGQCDAFVAVIGKSWLDGSNGRRLHESGDLVRFEIEKALERKKEVRLIPVLVENASMPRGESLPDSLKSLVRKQAIEISSTRFDSDLQQLLDILAKDNGAPTPEQSRNVAASDAPASSLVLPESVRKEVDSFTTDQQQAAAIYAQIAKDAPRLAAEREKIMKDLQEKIFSQPSQLVEIPRRKSPDEAFKDMEKYIRG